LSDLRSTLARPVNGASLGFFRAAFGTVIVYEALFFLRPSFLLWPERGTSLVERLYSGEHLVWHFSYPGFTWAKPLAEPWTSVLFGLFLCAAVLVATGVWFRPAIIVLWAAFSYIQLMEAAWYLNHFYLGALLAFLLFWMPADRRWSLRRWLADRNPHSEKIEKTLPREVPFWTVFVLRGQLFIVYFYGGIAKLSSDWLAGEPVRMWLRDAFVAGRLEQVVGPETMATLRPILGSEAVVWLITYGGLVFDLAVGPMLLWRRTRWLGILLAAMFHGTNFFLFDIGAFPVMAMLLTLIFFPPDWPDALRRRVTGLFGLRSPATASEVDAKQPSPSVGHASLRWTTATAIFVWFSVQLLLPLRHLAIAGNVHWTDEGSRFSWHMMLRHKEPGYVEFRVEDPALISQDSNGRKIVDWSQWQDREDASLWHEIRAEDWDETELPEFFITYEPVIGERLFFVPKDVQDSANAASEMLTEIWQASFGRRPQAVRVQRLAESLATIRDACLADESPDFTKAVQRSLAMAAGLAAVLDAGPADEQTRMVESARLQTLLRQLIRHPRLQRPIVSALNAAQPFAVLGGKLGSKTALAVRDVALERDGNGLSREVSRTGPAGQMAAYLDLTSLLPIEMARLPQYFVLHNEHGEPRIVWNYAAELHALQCRSLRSFAEFQHQYAQRIAEQWETLYGRRPAVHVTSYLALNRHPMQPLIDPAVDLAAEPLRLLRHNRWILPMAGTEDPLPSIDYDGQQAPASGSGRPPEAEESPDP